MKKPPGNKGGFFYFIFLAFFPTDSKPVREYESIGTVKLTFSNHYMDCRDGLIKKAKKEFPVGEGIILSFRPGQADKTDFPRKTFIFKTFLRNQKNNSR